MCVLARAARLCLPQLLTCALLHCAALRCVRAQVNAVAKEVQAALRVTGVMEGPKMSFRRTYATFCDGKASIGLPALAAAMKRQTKSAESKLCTDDEFMAIARCCDAAGSGVVDYPGFEAFIMDQHLAIVDPAVPLPSFLVKVCPRPLCVCARM